jgi:hypothetical protein
LIRACDHVSAFEFAMPRRSRSDQTSGQADLGSSADPPRGPASHRPECAPQA